MRCYWPSVACCSLTPCSFFLEAADPEERSQTFHKNAHTYLGYLRVPNPFAFSCVKGRPMRLAIGLDEDMCLYLMVWPKSSIVKCRPVSFIPHRLKGVSVSCGLHVCKSNTSIIIGRTGSRERHHQSMLLQVLLDLPNSPLHCRP